MERLTTRYTDHAALKLAKDIGEWCISHDPQKDDYSIYGDAVERLAAYEDTGLMPKDVTDLMAAHGTAILELSEYQSIGTAEHFKELAQAEQDGRLVMLPCKVGDTVYAINHHGRIVDGRVETIHQNLVSGKPGRVVLTIYFPEYNGTSESGLHPDFLPDSLICGIDDFGKTVYLTREEAEAALKGGAE